jgi:hypothetical protein
LLLVAGQVVGKQKSMPSVFQNPQVFIRTVVERSRRRAALLAVLLLGGWPRAVSAAPRQPPPPEPAPAVAARAPGSTLAPERQNYQLLLATSYVLAPLLALGVGGGLSKLETDDAVAVVGGGLMFLLPATVHIAHGNGGHGAASFGELFTLTALSAVAGGGVGFIVADAACSSDGDECDFAGLEGLIYGGLLGALAGYTGYAIYDVTQNAFVPDEEARSADATLRLWIGPAGSERRSSAGASNPWTGFQLGARLEL